MDYDLIIRGGTIVDGMGGEPFAGDVAVKGGRIAAIGRIEGSARDEIDANGMLVTPGFVDVHTHYDGQALWSERLAPSSQHGVTTAVMGNCGVGFAPVRAGDQDLLILAMEGVEDIPGAVMNAGLSWDWETFPQFLDALDSRPRDIDVAAYLPHSALRLYVMGERGANREPATPDDIEAMKEQAREAMAAGAIGFSTSRIQTHRRSDGEFIPSYGAAVSELKAIAGEAARGGGIFQIVPDLVETGEKDEARKRFDLLCDIARETGAHLTFSVAQMPQAPGLLHDILSWLTDANKEQGVSISCQTFPRPVGLVVGLELSAHPFLLCPTYVAMAERPLAERVAEMRKPEVRSRLLAEHPDQPVNVLTKMSALFGQMYAFGKTPDYEPPVEHSIANIAEHSGILPAEVIYDVLLEDEGHGKAMVAISNYVLGSLDFLRDVLRQPGVVVGLGDGGAHYGLVCDASYPTFMLTHWGRDRAAGSIPLPEVVRMLTSIPATMVGFGDRGRLAVGMKADINVIDHGALTLESPTVSFDLPGGGRRLMQGARGFKATIVSGTAILRNDQPTGALPGKLVRGRQTEPVRA